MNRKTLERYLKMYPEIDKELERLQGDLDYYTAELKKYQSMKIPGEQKKDMIRTIEDACASCAKEVQETMTARYKIDRLLRDMSPLQRQIIERRFWASKGKPDTWEYIANKLCFHPVYIKRLYKNVLDRLNSAI